MNTSNLTEQDKYDRIISFYLYVNNKIKRFDLKDMFNENINRNIRNALGLLSPDIIFYFTEFEPQLKLKNEIDELVEILPLKWVEFWSKFLYYLMQRMAKAKVDSNKYSINMELDIMSKFKKHIDNELLYERPVEDKLYFDYFIDFLLEKIEENEGQEEYTS